MRLRDVAISSVSVMLAVILFFAAGSGLDSINNQRRSLNLVIDKPENIPPSMAFVSAATGALRGLLVDVLWLRAEKLKEEGQFFDAKQLADWITTLQPRFASVWDFQSWNMAYNISVTIPATEPQERWRWVKNGYELLRDRGIPMNPRSILLYQRLAMIFQHKIGNVTDDDHLYYKLQLAFEMQPLLGPADNEHFNALANAPADWQAITGDPNFSGLIRALQAGDPAFRNQQNFVENYLSLRQNPGRFSSDAAKAIDAFRSTQALDKFDIFAKAWQLRNSLKLEPKIMLQLNQLYGPVSWDDPNKHLPLEWRHPDTHAIYWAFVGLQNASRENFSANEANTDRIINQSLQNLFRQGKIYIFSAPVSSETAAQMSDQKPAQREPNNLQVIQQIYMRPDLRMFIPYNESATTRIEKYEKLRPNTAEAMQIGHRNMLRNAVFAFYQAGHRTIALQIYEWLRKLYPLDEFKVSLDEYARNRFRTELEDIGLNYGRELIQTILQEAYFRYAMRDDDEAAIRENTAKQVFDYYRVRFGDDPRLALPDFNRLKYLSLIDFFRDPQYPQELSENLKRRIEIENPALYEEMKKQERQLISEVEKSQQK